MINFNKYCSQLDQLEAVLEEKCPESVNRKRITLHQDNARLHACFFDDQAKTVTLGWEVLIHLLYSPDITSSAFHLFWPLQNSLNGKNFNSLEECKWHLEQFFAEKNKSIGKMKL